MKFRLTAFGLHLLGSACVLAVVLGALYLGWYRWPGWYLTGVLSVVGVMASVDVVLGPLLTLVIANPNKPRKELARDISIIVSVQVVALLYGAATLWHGRPLYYTYSEKWLEVVQASDFRSDEIKLAAKENPLLAPHWYNRPRWVWAPLPDDAKTANDIVNSAIGGGADVTQMPRYFKPWDRGLAQMRSRLKALDTFTEFSLSEKKTLRARMIEEGFATDQPDAMVMMGRARPLLAIVDTRTGVIKALIRCN